MQWSQNLCRTCGQISETCHYIYNKDVPSTLENKIKQYLNLNLHKGDYKPKQICNNCVIKLNSFAEFMDICHSTNEKFDSIYFNSQTWHNYDKHYDYPRPQKQSVIVSNKQAADNLDFELYKNTGIVLENLNTTNCQLNDSELLDFVGNGDHNLENCLRQTKVKEHCNTVLEPPTYDEQPVKYNRHNVENGESKKICYIKYNNSYSAISVTSNIEWPKEVDVKMEKKRTVTVDSVKKFIRLPQNRKLAIRREKKIYPCPHCKKVFLRSGTLKSHMAQHTKIRPYKCEECSKTFAVKSHLTTHKKVHGDHHKCPFCYKKFTAPSKLKRHIRIHTNDKPYMCNFGNCKKSFSDKRNLEGHKLTHVTEKKYSCVVCNKMFKTLDKLKRHSKCHSSRIKYSCDLCSKTYKYKSNLASHIKKHNNICPHCKKNCKSNTLLAEHLKSCRVHH